MINRMIFHSDVTAVFFYDSVTYGKAKTGAGTLGLGGKERIEDLGEDVRFDAAS